MVGRVGFADQAMPPVASADADLESAVRLRVRGEQLDANLSGGTPGPPRGGKPADLFGQRRAIQLGEPGDRIRRIAANRGSEELRIPGVAHRFRHVAPLAQGGDRKSTRLNSSHQIISYA